MPGESTTTPPNNINTVVKTKLLLEINNIHKPAPTVYECNLKSLLKKMASNVNSLSNGSMKLEKYSEYIICTINNLCK